MSVRMSGEHFKECNIYPRIAATPFARKFHLVAISHASINSRVVRLTTHDTSRRPACPSSRSTS
eukprot:scaffold32934_cov175-Skeletonema_marinoi.AAC.4